MLPYIHIFGRQIPMYGIMTIIAAFFTVLLVRGISKYKGVSKEDAFYAALYAAVGAIVGSKLLYIITAIPALVEHFDVVKANPSILLELMMGGFVFYGGLFGAILGVFLYAKEFKIPFKDLIVIAAPAIPLFHSIARIGCFCAGCCYGIEYDGPLHVVFQHSIGAPNGVSLLPVQLIESLCNFVIFIVLLLLVRKPKTQKYVFGLYLILYGITRFVLEFFRGDELRGFIGILSTSQLISIIAFVAGIIILIKAIKNNKKSE